MSGVFQPDEVIAGRFTVEAVLGEGGMGFVYAVRDARHPGSSLALKTIRVDLTANRTILSRFRREAELMSRIHAPGLIWLFESDLDADPPWLLMERAKGIPLPDGSRAVTLDKLVEAYAGRLPETVVLDLMDVCLQGLSALHAAGVVHRDLKPQNILLDDAGDERDDPERSLRNLKPKIADLGLAAVKDREASNQSIGEAATMLTQHGRAQDGRLRAVLGSLDYMSPEQRRNEALNPASDIYSLTKVLFYTLSGQAMGASPVSKVRPNLSPAWDAFLAGGYPADPARRYADAGTMWRALQELRRKLTIESDARQAQVPVHSPQRQSGTKSWRTIALPALGALVLAGLGAGIWRAGDSSRQETMPANRIEVGDSHDTRNYPLPSLRGELLVRTLPGAWVSATWQGQQDRTIALGTVGDDGLLHYDRLVEGEYSLEITHPDYHSRSLLVEIRNDRAAAADGRLEGLPGSIFIAASPQAEVWVDGERRGRTGEKIAEVPAGRRRFEIRRAGYRTERFEETIPPNAAAPRKVLGDLVRESGSIRFEAEVPAGAQAHFEGLDKRIRIGTGEWTPVAVLPHTLDKLSCEEHEVRLEVAGFTVDATSRRVQVRDGQAVTARFRFTPDPARLTVTANAAGAEVFDAAGRRLAAGGTVFETVPLVPLTLTVRAEGHVEKTERLGALAPGRAYTHRVTLEPIRGLVRGRDWTSPATGMEFVWVPVLRIWVGKFEVTNGEYREKEPRHDSGSYRGHSLNGDRQPVVQVNFDDAKAYAEWLTQQDQVVLGEARYRLPNEREWMTFAQCGDGREYPWGDYFPPYSGHAGNYSGQESPMRDKIVGYNDGFPVTAPVDRLWQNPWGLYGVGGNVKEACVQAGTDAEFGAWRGASWTHSSQDIMRCAYRYAFGSSYREHNYGFRLVLSR